jgi:hypothetical protein
MHVSGTWLGAMGGGFSGSLLLGGSAYQINLWNTGGGPVPMPVLVTGFRAGLMAQVEAGHAFCLLTGVKSENDLKELKSQGLDWCLSIGGDVDAAVKTSGVVFDLLKAAAKSTGNWAAQESAKKAVQLIFGDFEIKPSGPSFILLPSPASLGAGAGLFYEWQTMTRVGTDVAWRYIQPTWRVSSEGGKLKLFMDSIPESNGTTIGLQFRLDTWGADDVLIFDTDRQGMVNMRYTDKLKTVHGLVNGGTLCDPVTKAPGLNLSDLVPYGKLDVGMLTTSRTTDVAKNTSIKIGVSVCKSAFSETNLYKWSSSDYAEVQTDQTGKMTSSKDSRKKK